MRVGELIRPISLESFFSQYWEKAPLLIQRNDEAYYGRVLSVDDVDSVLARNDITFPDVRLVANGKSVSPETYTRKSRHSDQVRIVDSDKIYAALAAGTTVVMNGLHRSLEGLSSLTSALEQELLIPTQTNVYLTPRSSQGFTAHWDTHDVMVLQIAGSKRWLVYDSPVELPTENMPFELESWNRTEPTREACLSAGDLLYLPRGFIHEAKSTDTYSIHITVGFVGGLAVGLLREMTRIAECDLIFRKIVPRCVFTDDDARQHFRDEFKRHVGRLLNESFDEVLDSYQDNFISRRFPKNRSRLRDMEASSTITSSTILRVREGLMFKIRRLKDGVCVVCSGKRVTLPSYAESTLVTMLGGREFTCSELGGPIDAAGKLVLARRLITEGLLKIAA